VNNRLKIFIAIVVIFGVIVCVRSCVTRVSPDLTVAYIGYDFVNKEAFNASEEAKSAVGDLNGDGQVKIEIMEISFSETLGSGDFQNSKSKMAAAVGGGTARLYFMDKAFIDKNIDSGVFGDITSLGDGLKDSSGAVVAIDISGNENVKSLGIENTEDMYLCVRVVSELDEAYNKNVASEDAAARRLAEWILS